MTLLEDYKLVWGMLESFVHWSEKLFSFLLHKTDWKPLAKCMKIVDKHANNIANMSPKVRKEDEKDTMTLKS